MAKNYAAAKPAAMRVCRLFCKKSEKFAKIGLTFQIRSGKMCPRPASRAARKGSGGSNEPKPRQGRARQFSRTRTFRGAHEPLRSGFAGSLQFYHKRPCREGVPERIKRGREKVVTRAVAQAGMLPKGSGAGYTRHCQKVRKKILMVQQFLQNILWRV